MGNALVTCGQSQDVALGNLEEVSPTCRAHATSPPIDTGNDLDVQLSGTPSIIPSLSEILNTRDFIASRSVTPVIFASRRVAVLHASGTKKSGAGRNPGIRSARPSCGPAGGPQHGPAASAAPPPAAPRQAAAAAAPARWGPCRWRGVDDRVGARRRWQRPCNLPLLLAARRRCGRPWPPCHGTAPRVPQASRPGRAV